MNKLLLSLSVITLIFLSSCATTEEVLDFSDLQAGYYFDARHNAIWEIQSDGIRILDSKNKVEYWDFRDYPMHNFTSEVEASSVVVSFTMVERGWDYILRKSGSTSNIQVKITMHQYRDKPRDFVITYKGDNLDNIVSTNAGLDISDLEESAP